MPHDAVIRTIRIQGENRSAGVPAARGSSAEEFPGRGLHQLATRLPTVLVVLEVMQNPESGAVFVDFEHGPPPIVTGAVSVLTALQCCPVKRAILSFNQFFEGITPVGLPAKTMQHRQVLTVLLDFEDSAEVRGAAINAHAIQQTIAALDQAGLNVVGFYAPPLKTPDDHKTRSILVDLEH